MKCKKCKTKLPRNQYVCPACKAQAPRHTGRLATTLVILVLVLSMILSGGIFTWRYLGGVFAKDIFNPQSTDPQGAPAVDVSKTPTLSLYVDDQNVNVGMESTVNFHVVSDTSDFSAVNIVNTKDFSVLTELGQGTVTADGKTEYSGKYTFTPQEATEIPIRAYAGEKFSEETTIRVFAPVSEEGHEEFRNVVSEMGDYVETMDFSELSPEEELTLMENWLSSHDGVDDVHREGDRVYYRTNGGVLSYYTTSNTNRFILGEDSAKDDFKENTTAVEYYEAWEKNRNALRQRDGDISYLPADITITNSNSLILIPTKHTESEFKDPILDKPYAKFFSSIRNSPKLQGGSVDIKDTPQSVMEALQNHSLSNYGMVCLLSHGANEGRFAFSVFHDTSLTNWQNFEKQYKHLLTYEGAKDDDDATFRLRHFQRSVPVGKDPNTGKTLYIAHYFAEVSSNYIMDLYRDYTFDNTIFIMGSCSGLSDDMLNDFLLDRGAQCIIGSDQNISFGTLFAVFEDILKPMFENADNRESKLHAIWQKNVFDGATSYVYDSAEHGQESISFEEYWEEYKNHVEWYKRDKKEDILLVNGNIIEADRIKNYLSWKDSAKFDIMVTPYPNACTNSHGYSRDAGTYDYTCKVNDKLEVLTKDNKDFAFGGSGEISGTLYKGKTIRTFAPDGSHTDQVRKGEILPAATVTAHRFLNQSFPEVAKVESDTNGNFTFTQAGDNPFPWGHYVLTAEYASYKGKTSIILTEDSVNGGEFIVSGGDSKIEGYIEGRKNASDSATKIIPNAQITLTSSDFSEQISSDSNGYFAFGGLKAGDYTMTVEMDTYEKYQYDITVESGFEYIHEKGSFILEPLDTTKEVVLVLDVSSSMSGDPLKSTKMAVKRFAETVFASDDGYSVSIVTFSTGARLHCAATKYASTIEKSANQLSTSGRTNPYAGLQEAKRILDNSKAKNKSIVLMSDGDPNEGRTGDSLIAYADELKNDGITIYTLGFFVKMTDEALRKTCRELMDALATKGYHYEVASESDLVPFFNAMADQVSGTAYTLVNVACPVDVTVSYNGETLSSAADNLCTRTSFGTLMFDGDASDPTKILRLREGIDYDIIIKGTDKGKMDYSISYADSKGNYSDTRSYKNVKITKNFTAQTNTKKTDSTIMNIDENGDGKVDKVLVSKKNKDSFELKTKTLLLYAVLAVVVLIISIVITLFLRKVIVGHMNKKRDRILAATAAAAVRAQSAASMSAFCTECGKKIAPDAMFCENCGTKRE